MHPKGTGAKLNKALTAAVDVQVDVSKAWISFSSIVVAFSFIFSTAIQNTFMSVIFLFVVHPYDVGDGIMIGTDLHFVRPRTLHSAPIKLQNPEPAFASGVHHPELQTT